MRSTSQQENSTNFALAPFLRGSPTIRTYLTEPKLIGSAYREVLSAIDRMVFQYVRKCLTEATQTLEKPKRRKFAFFDNCKAGKIGFSAAYTAL